MIAQIELCASAGTARQDFETPTGPGIPYFSPSRVLHTFGATAYTCTRSREFFETVGAARSRRGINAVDPCACERAAHKAGVQHAGPGDVIDEAATAGQQAAVSTRCTRVPAYRGVRERVALPCTS